jgi:hypothetical protein
MATSHEIKCINKPNRYNEHERIVNIGGLNNNGTSWKMSLDTAIKGIEEGEWTFYVYRKGIKVNVVIAEKSGTKYLKTEADDSENNNLLELPECK